MKKFLCLFLTAVLLMGCFAIVNVAADDEPVVTTGDTADENGPGSAAYTANLVAQGYKPLSSFEDIDNTIRKVYKDANENPTDADKAAKKAAVLSDKYYLTADIVVTDTGDYMLDEFSGIFDGNGHTLYNTQNVIFDDFSGTVRNLYLSPYTDATETEPFNTTNPVFGNPLLDGAVIENIVHDRVFGMVSNYWGAFVRAVDDGATVTFIGCVNNTEVSSPYVPNNHKLGGFIGMSGANTTITFKNCINNARIEGSQVGGFVGVIEKKGATLTFENCVNNGSIEGIIGSSSGSSAYGVSGGFIGGFNNVGKLEGNIKITMENCVNTGNVRRVSKNNPVSKSTKVCSGGLIGDLGVAVDGFGIDLTIKNCFITDCVIGGTTSASGKPEDEWEDLVKTDEDTGETIVTDRTQGYAGAIIGWLDNSKGTNKIDIDGVTVYNVDVKAGDPATASALINVESKTNVVALKNVYVMASTYTSVGTGAFTIENDAKNDENLKVQKAQASTPVDGALKVRFLGGLDTLNYLTVGYMVEKIVGGKSEYFFLETRTVYEEVNNGEGKLTKSDFGDRYIVAIPLEDIAADQTVGFKVTPYAVTDEDYLVIGATKSITLTNGALS